MGDITLQPPVLSIAGSDSSGGAGVQADLKTFTSLGCYGATVLTALTAQNTVGVRGIQPCDPEFVEQQLRAVLDDIPVRAIKTGMLTDKPIIEKIVKTLEEYSVSQKPYLVVDPVMMSTSGHRLLETSAIGALKTRLVPLATIVTPNLHEANILLPVHLNGETQELASVKEIKTAARSISDSYGVPNVLIKGGHFAVSLSDIGNVEDAPDTLTEYTDICDPAYPAILAGAARAEELINEHGIIVDVLFTKDQDPEGRFVVFVRPRLNTQSTHGTGCTLSAAIACGLAMGSSIIDATRKSIAYTHNAIAHATPLGKGHGPLNHMHALSVRIIPRPTPMAPHPFVSTVIASARNAWGEYVRHDFVRQLGSGVLPQACFKHFIKQDYLYLKYYARAHGMLALKSSTFADIGVSAAIMQHIVLESSMHEYYCLSWGIQPALLLSTGESAATTAYGAYILDVGTKGNALDLLVALAACLLGYGEVGLWLKGEAEKTDSWVKLEGNPYRKWMDDYGGSEYQKACLNGLRILEGRIALESLSQGRYDDLARIWQRCVELERGFWDMAMSEAR